MSTSAREGPPEWEWPSPRQEAGPDHRRTTSQQTSYRPHRQRCGSYADRRRSASYRLPVLEAGRSAPWWYQPPGPNGYEQAALHLLERGLLPAADRGGLRGMHRSGGTSGKAARHIAQAWELVA